LIVGILERASGPMTMAEIEAHPEALAAKLCREDTQFVLRALAEEGRITQTPGCPWRYQIKGKSFGPELAGLTEKTEPELTAEARSRGDLEGAGFYCPEHKYSPAPNSGFAFCPQCEAR
jgi:hypothetical protein